MIEAIILAGGKGTRLSPLTDHLPKPLVPILGKPMIDYVLEHLAEAGLCEIAIAVAHLGQMIVDYVGDGSRFGLRISYLYEETPQGTGGWVNLIDHKKLAPHFLVLNADNLFWIDVHAFFARHQQAGAVATIAAIERPSSEIQNYEILAPQEDFQRLKEYIDRKASALYLKDRSTAYISSGWYIFTPQALVNIEKKTPLSMETDVWPALSRSNQPLGFYPASEPWFDSGTPERLQRVADFLTNGRR